MFNNLVELAKNPLRPYYHRLKFRGYYRLKYGIDNKIFCIGYNKTSTSSLRVALEEYGFIVRRYGPCAVLINEWYQRKFTNIINLCYAAQLFIDVPFCLPYTFIVLDQYFPNSKFILTVRDNPEQWYNSLINFHTKLWGNGNIPSPQQLKNADLLYKGWAWDMMRASFPEAPSDDPYQKNILIDSYNRHIKSAKDYFSSHKDKLLIINVSAENSYLELCDFLHLKPLREKFPWINKTNQK